MANGVMFKSSCDLLQVLKDPYESQVEPKEDSGSSLQIQKDTEKKQDDLQEQQVDL